MSYCTVPGSNGKDVACLTTPGNVRVCERGTLGCVWNHEALPEEPEMVTLRAKLADSERNRDQLRTWLDESSDRANKAACDALNALTERDRTIVELGTAITDRDSARLALVEMTEERDAYRAKLCDMVAECQHINTKSWPSAREMCKHGTAIRTNAIEGKEKGMRERITDSDLNEIVRIYDEVFATMKAPSPSGSFELSRLAVRELRHIRSAPTVTIDGLTIGEATCRLWMAELRHLRSLALTAEEREALAWARVCVVQDMQYPMDRHAKAVAVLDRLLRSPTGEP